MKYFFYLILCALLCVNNIYAQNKNLTLEEIALQNTFAEQQIEGFYAMNDGLSYTVLEDNRTKIVKYSFKSNAVKEVLFDIQQRKDDFEMDYIRDYQFDTLEFRILFGTNAQSVNRNSYTADYYLYDFKNHDIRPLSKNGRQREALFSPGGRYVAFARNNNLFIYDTRFGSERAITSDGLCDSIINGVPDWVSEEEFGVTRAFEWASDESALAYIRYDESQVTSFPLMHNDGLYPTVSNYKYPKAGERNATISVRVYDLSDRTTQTMNIGDETDHYIPRIYYTRDPKKLAIVRLNRPQNLMELLFANVRTGASNVIYRDKNTRYIDEFIYNNICFLEDGQQMVIPSEKSGFMHFYLYNVTGQLKRALTSGNFDATDFYGYDAKNQRWFYASHENSPIEKHVYMLNTKGVKTQLTTAKGWNDAFFNRNFAYYIQSNTDLQMPVKYEIRNLKGQLLRKLGQNTELKANLASYALPTVELTQLPSADAQTRLEAWVMKPLNFDAAQKYPLLIVQYSGPNSQMVQNSWQKISWMHYLAQQGYVIAAIDPRGTGARGEEFRKCTYRQLGKIEREDIVAATRALTQESWIDTSRVAIWGWSYGGFISLSSMMAGDGLFSTAIAVAPVTSFRFYDSIYTERYMDLPRENEQGYDENAPVNMAAHLNGRLLICHGTADDNVHVQNSLAMSDSLVKANKMFDMMIYNNRNHSIYGENTRLQLYMKFVDFLMKK